MHSKQTEKFQLNTGQPAAAAWRDSYADWDKAVEMAGNRLMLVHSSSSDPSWQNVWGSVLHRLAPLCVEKQARMLVLPSTLSSAEAGFLKYILCFHFFWQLCIICFYHHLKKLAAHKVVVYMKRLPLAYDAAVDHFLLWAPHGRRDHALFVMGQLYALDKGWVHVETVLNAVDVMSREGSHWASSILSRHCVTILLLVMFPHYMCLSKPITAKHISHYKRKQLSFQL